MIYIVNLSKNVISAGRSDQEASVGVYAPKTKQKLRHNKL